MAISYVGAGTAGTGANPTVAVPTQARQGDLLLIVTTSTATPSTPSGWTPLATQGANRFITVFYKFAGASESSVTLTLAPTVSRAQMIAYHGVLATDTISAFTATASGSSLATSTLTTSAANSFVLSIFGSGTTATATWTPPASTNTRVTTSSSTTVGGLLIVDVSQAAAGASTARTATISTTNSISAVQIAITPDSGERYWVGGTGTWDNTTTTNWSYTTGGAAGAPPPTALDPVFFDANSNTGTGDFTVTIGANVNCLNLVTTGIDPATAMTVAGTGTLTVNGTAFTLTNLVSWTHTGTITFSTPLATTCNVTTAGVSLAAPITFNGTNLNTSVLNFVDNFTTTGTLTLTRGVVQSTGNNKTITADNLSLASGPAAVTVNTGASSVFNFTGNNKTVFSGGTGQTWTTPTAGINLTYSGSTGTRTITATLTTVAVNVTAGSDTVDFPLASIGSLNFTGFTGTWFTNTNTTTVTGSLTVSTGMTVGSGTKALTLAGTGTITTNGKTLDFPVTVNSTTTTLGDALTLGSTRTFTFSGGTLAMGANDLTTGTFSSTAGTRTITSTTGQIFITGSSGTILTATGTITNGGVFNCNTGGAGTRTLNVTTNTSTVNITGGSDTVTFTASNAVGPLNFTGFTGTWTNVTMSINGNLTISSGMTVGSGTGIVSLLGTGTVTTNGKTLDFSVTVNSTTTTLGDPLTLGSTRTFTLTSGTLAMGANHLTAGLFSTSGSSTRSITRSTGLIYVTGNAATVLTIAGTGLTIGSGLVFYCTYSGSTGTRTLNVSSNTAPSVSITAGTDIVTFTASNSTGSLDFTGFAGTWTNVALTITGSLTTPASMTVGAGANAVTLAGTGTVTTNGELFDFPVTVNGTSTALGDNLTLGSTRTFTFGGGTLIMGSSNLTTGIFTSTSGTRTITRTTGQIFITGNATTVLTVLATVTLPAGLVFTCNYAGATGTRTLNITQTTAEVDIVSGTDIVAVTASNTFQTLDFTGFAGTFTNVAFSIGNLIISTGMTLTAGANAVTFNKASSSFQTSGKVIDFPVTLTTTATVLTLLDSVFIGSTRTFTFSGGTLAMGNNDLYAGLFTSASGTRTITHGTGQIYVTGNAATVLTLTATITIPADLYFYCNYSGATGTRTLSITQTDVDVYVTAGTDIVTVVTGSDFTLLDFTGFSGSFGLGTSAISLGTLIISTGMTTAGSSTASVTFNKTASSLTTNGKTLNFNVTASTGATGVVTLADNCTVATSNIFGLLGGELRLTSYTLIAGGFNLAGTSTAKSITRTSGSLQELNGNGITVLSVGTSSAVTATTFYSGFAFNLTYAGATGTRTINSVGSVALPTINVTAGTDTVTFTASNTVGPVDFTGFSGTLSNVAFTVGAGLTISPTMTLTAGINTVTLGNGGNLTTAGKTFDFPVTVTAGITLLDTLTMGSTRLFTHSGGTIDIGSFNLVAGYLSVSTTTAKTWSHTTGALTITGNAGTVLTVDSAWTFTTWSGFEFDLTYAGATGTRTINVVGGQTTPSINFLAGTDTVDFTTSNSVGSVDFTGFAGTWTAGVTMTFGGAVVISTGMTLGSSANTKTFSGTATSLNTNGKTLDFPVGVSGTATVFTLNSNLTMGSTRTLTWVNGAIALGDNTVSTGLFVAASGSSTSRVMTRGTGGITITGNAGTVLQSNFGTGTITYSSGITFTLTYAGATGTRTIDLVGNTGAVNVAVTAGTDIVTLTASNNLTSLDFTGFAGTFSNVAFSIGYLYISSGMTVSAGTGTVTFNQTASGLQTSGKTIDFPISVSATAGYFELLDNLTQGSTRLLTHASGEIRLTSYTMSVGQLNISGTSTKSWTKTSGSLTAITGSAAAVLATSAAGIANTTFYSGFEFNLTYAGSTGTRTFNVLGGAGVPTINITAGTDIITFTASNSTGSVNFTGFAGTLTNVAFTVTGSLTIASGMTLTAGVNALTLSGTGTVTTAGKTFDFPVTVLATSQTLADTLTVGTTRTFTLTAGTLALGANDLTTGLFSSAAGTITRSSGQIYVTGSGATVLTVAGLTLPAGLIFYCNYSGAVGTRTLNIDVNSTVINVSAGSDTISVSSNDTIGTLDFTGFSGTFTRTASFSTQTLVVSSGMTLNSGTAAITFTGTGSITTAGKTFDFPVTINSTTTTLNDPLTLGSTRALTLTGGTLALGSNEISAGTITATGGTAAVTRTSTNAITITGSGVTVAALSGTTTWNSIPLNFNYSGATGTRTFNVTDTGSIVNITAGTDIVVFTASNTAGSIDFTGFSGSWTNVALDIYGNLTLSSTMTVSSGVNAVRFYGFAGVTNTVTTNGKTLDFPISKALNSSITELADNLTVGSTRTFTLTAGTLALGSNKLIVGTFTTSTAAGSFPVLTATTGSVDIVGSGATIMTLQSSNGIYTGVNFNLTYSGGTGTRTISTLNTLNSGSYYPNINVTAGTDTVVFATASYTGALNFTGFSGTLAQTTSTLYIYGNLTLSTGMSVTGTTGVLQTRGTGTVTTNGKSIPNFTIQQDLATDSTTLTDNLTVTTALILSQGVFDAAGYNVTASTFTSTTTSTRTLAMGAGDWTITGSGTAWAVSSQAAQTLTGTAKIYMTSGTAKTFSGGGETYPTLVQAGAGVLTINGSNTFDTITNTVIAGITLASSSTQTVTNFTVNGADGNLLTLQSSSGSVVAILSKPSGVVATSYLAIIRVTATGGASWYAANSTLTTASGWISGSPSTNTNPGAFLQLLM